MKFLIELKYQTWVEAVTGHVSSLQPLGELMCEEHITQFAVGIYPEDIPERLTYSKLLVGAKSVKVKVTMIMQIWRYGDNAAWRALFQSVQQQVSQEEVTKVIDAKHKTKTIFSSALHINS